MSIPNPLPQIIQALEKSIGMWFGVWAIRYKAGLDYKLSTRAGALRWAIVITFFALTALPGASLGWLRVSSFLVGLAFLCWPNLAYHSGNLFEKWPTTEGRVNSLQAQTDSKWLVAYDFEVDGERYGGHDTMKSKAAFEGRDSVNDASVLIRYDPMNPGRTSHIEQRG